MKVTKESITELRICYHNKGKTSTHSLKKCLIRPTCDLMQVCECNEHLQARSRVANNMMIVLQGQGEASRSLTNMVGAKKVESLWHFLHPIVS